MSTIAWILIYLAITYQGNIFAGACTDKNNYCSYWAKQGECTKNPLYMLHQCPISCNVCFGGVVCTNVYNDQYCALQIGNCWNPSNVNNLVKNCKKTCVCGCCSAIPATTKATTNPATTTIPTTTTTAATTPTTVRSTNVRTASQTTEGTGEGKTTAHALTKFSTQTPSKSKGPSSSPTTGEYVHYSEQDPAGRIDKKGFNPILLATIIAGVVVVIGVLGLSVFCLWRKRRAASSNAEGKSRPSEESPEVPVADSPETPLYYVLEESNFPSPSKNQTLSAEYERPSEGLLSDAHYDDTVDQGACAVGNSPSKARDNEPQLYEDVDEHNTKNVLYEPSNGDAPNIGDYCYSYSVANEDLTLRVNKNRPQEHPDTQNVYQPLESSNAGYQAPEKETRGDGGYEVMRDIDPAGYLPLKKPTQEKTFYHPLTKEK